jgi:predicted O-linked N-acetylglucosamine transferase (SPINDLY family)
MKFTECVAADRDEYVELSLQLARDRDRRRATSARIVESLDQIFEDVQAGAELESLFLRLVADAPK